MSWKQFWHILALSFYSKDLYGSVGLKWKHWGLNFLLKFSILSALLSSIVLFVLCIMLDLNAPTISSIINNFPELHIVNGKAEILDQDTASPYYISLPQTHKNVIIIDTKISSSEHYTQDAMIFTKDRIALNSHNAGVLFTIPYTELFRNSTNIHLNSTMLKHLLDTTKSTILGIILVLSFPICSLVYFVLILLKATFYAALANLIGQVFKYKLTFLQLTRLAVIASAPSFIISNLLILCLIGFMRLNMITNISDTVFLLYFLTAIFTCKNLIKERHS